MEEPASHDLQASRKRHRSDETSAASFRMPHSMPSENTKLAHHRPVVNHSQQDNDHLPTASAEIPNPVLEPLHPPIPNFSAISQGASRPNSTPHPTGDPPGGIIYNIALPLPNPGRAHRFCQACDHVSILVLLVYFSTSPCLFFYIRLAADSRDIVFPRSLQINHVRRKLCTNCGAPKPSAVRNAVGVRSITEVETSADRRPIADGAFRTDYSQAQVLPGSMSPTFQNSNDRFNPPGHSQEEQKTQRPSEHSLHQARSLAMKCPGDDIPLLGNSSKPNASLSNTETHASRRLRAGPALLCEPLVNFSTFQNAEVRPQPNPFRGHHGNPVDFNQTQKLFPDHSDRDQYTLPSMHGMQNQRPVYATASVKLQSRSDVMDGRMGMHTGQPYDKLHEEPLADDVLSLNRAAIAHNSEPRDIDRRYSNIQGPRHIARDVTDQTQIYNPMQDTHAHPGLLYKPTHELYPVHQQHHQFRSDDRDQGFEHDTSRRLRLNQTMVDPSHDHFRAYSQPLDVQRQHAGGRPLEPMSSIRNGFDGDRMRNIASDNRVVQSHMAHLQKHDDEVSATPYEDSNRHPDESRFALENLLMQRKANRNTWLQGVADQYP